MADSMQVIREDLEQVTEPWLKKGIHAEELRLAFKALWDLVLRGANRPIDDVMATSLEDALATIEPHLGERKDLCQCVRTTLILGEPNIKELALSSVIIRMTHEVARHEV